MKTTNARVNFIFSRALRTVLLAIAGGLAVDLAFDMQSLWLLASSALLAGILSVLTGLVDLPEWTAGTQSKVTALLSRTAKTFGQVVIAGIPTTAIFLSEVQWQAVLVQAGVAALGSLLLAIAMTLPEEIPQERGLIL